MNMDESSGPNRSLSSMPDHSNMPGDFPNYSVDKSSVPHSPSASHYKKKKDMSSVQNLASRSNAYQSYAGDHQSSSNYYERNNDGDTWIRDAYDEGTRDRRLNPQPNRDRANSNRSHSLQSNLQSNLPPFANDDLGEVEVDHSYKTFLKLKRLYVYIVFNVVCTLIMILNIYFAYSTDQTHFAYLEKVDNQFQSRLIIDMNLMDPSSDCTGLYVNAKMGRWNGYERLCQCEGTLTERECTPSQIASGCMTIGPMNPIDFSFWDGKRVCLRKSEGSVKDYYQKLVVNSAGESSCEEGLPKCTVASNGNAVCMGRFEFCPITKIAIDEASNETSQKKSKGQLHFRNKTLLLENDENKGTSLLDLVIREDDCLKYQDPTIRASCDAEKLLIYRLSEYDVVRDNTPQPEKFEVIKNLNKSIGLFGEAADFLEMCKFNKTFNPVILSNELGNWERVKTLRFVNPFFICSLLIINFVRTSVLDYLNTKTTARIIVRRKKELYNVFGFFTGSSVMITCQVLIILYYIFWGYLLLNQSRLIGQRWLDMACVKGDLREDIQLMMGEISKVEAYNMVTIGPMIVCCILEALFAQYKMINLDVMDQLRD